MYVSVERLIGLRDENNMSRRHEAGHDKFQLSSLSFSPLSVPLSWAYLENLLIDFDELLGYFKNVLTKKWLDSTSDLKSGSRNV